MNKLNKRQFETWLLTVASMALLATCTNGLREISQGRFIRLVEDKEVKQVTIVNGEFVEIELTPEALATKYHGLFNDLKDYEGGKPSLRLLIISEQAFRGELAEMNATFPVLTEKRGIFGFSH